MIDLLLNYVPAILFGIVGGCAAYWRVQVAQYRTAAAAAMNVLLKAEARGVFFSPHDRSIMQAVDVILRKGKP